ncbi:MAG: T9SS type A sorting domain-containing protein [Bacteroidia bacterium]
MSPQTSTSVKSYTVAFATLVFGLLIIFQAKAVPVTISTSSNFTAHQNVSFSGPYVSGSSGPRYLGPSEDITINSGITLTINQGNHTVKSIKMGSGGTGTVTLKINSAFAFTVTEGLTSNTSGQKKLTFLSTGMLTSGGFSGSNYVLAASNGTIHMTGGNLPGGVVSFYNLTINAPGSTITLNSNVSITNTLELKNGILDISTYNLTVARIAGSSGIAGTAPSQSSFVRTSSGGTLERSAGQGILFPVGASVYAPVTLGVPIAKNFKVNVIDGIDDINGVPVYNNVILNTWTISSTSSVTADVLVTLGWLDESKEGAGFDDTKNSLFIFEPGDTIWSNLNAYTNETSNSQQNLAVNKFQNTLPYKFAVGDTSGLALLNNTVALPVDLISFTAVKQADDMAMLNWSTAWEINNDRFEIERSTNGISWNKIGFVTGKGNSTQINNYSFPTSLAHINSPVVYYRLKQIDFNGQFEYSAIRTLRLNVSAAAMSVELYPNPARSKIFVKLEKIPVGEMATISIIDMSGKVLLSVKHIMEEDKDLLDLNIDNLLTGNYIVNVSSSIINYNKRLIKL